MKTDKMSLDYIEKFSNTKSFKDPEMIEDILNRFLDIKYKDCTVDSQSKNFPCREISDSFDLDKNKLFYKSTLKEFLTLIGYQYSAPHLTPYCEDLVPKLGKNFLRINHRAINPLNIWLILRINSENPSIKLFEHIDYASFITYLEVHIKNSGKLSQKDLTNRVELLHKIYDATCWFCEKYGFYVGSDIKIGDIMKTVKDVGFKPWPAGCITLKDYSDRITQAYSVAQALFLDSIRMNFIDFSRDDFRNILNKYSETKHYSDEFWFEILKKKVTCYEFEIETR